MTTGTPGYIAPEVALGEPHDRRPRRRLRARLRRLFPADGHARLRRPESDEHGAQARADAAGSAVARAPSCRFPRDLERDRLQLPREEARTIVRRAPASCAAARPRARRRSGRTRTREAWWERHLPPTSSLRSFAQHVVAHARRSSARSERAAVQTASFTRLGDDRRRRLMIAHQVAAKAVRDATFLSAWPATALPAMVIATAVVVVAAVPDLLAAARALRPAAWSCRSASCSARPATSSSGSSPARARGSPSRSTCTSPASARCCSPASGRSSASCSIRRRRAASYGRIAAAGTLGGLLGGLGDGPARARRRRHDAAADARGAACRAAVGLWRRPPRAGESRVRRRRSTATRAGLFGFDVLRTAPPHLDDARRSWSC